MDPATTLAYFARVVLWAVVLTIAAHRAVFFRAMGHKEGVAEFVLAAAITLLIVHGSALLLSWLLSLAGTSTVSGTFPWVSLAITVGFLVWPITKHDGHRGVRVCPMCQHALPAMLPTHIFRPLC